MKSIKCSIVIVLFSLTLGLQAHETEEKLSVPGFRPRCDQAAAFLESVGTCRMLVLPTIVHTLDGLSYSMISQDTIVAHLKDKALADPNSYPLELELSQTQGPAQWGFFQSGMKAMGEQIKPLTLDTDYVLAVELLIPPARDNHPSIFGIHIYILSPTGDNAFSFLLNSHHQLFVDAKLKAANTSQEAMAKLVADSTQVALTALDQQIQQARPEIPDVND